MHICDRGAGGRSASLIQVRDLFESRGTSCEIQRHLIGESRVKDCPHFEQTEPSRDVVLWLPAPDLTSRDPTLYPPRKDELADPAKERRPR